MRCCLLFAVCLLAACETGAASGTLCSRSSDCRGPLVCRLDRCRNECRENRDCANGARCLLDQDGLGACSVVTDERCGSGGTDCPTSLTCVNERCVNTCTTLEECPADGECREAVGVGVSFCFAPDREDGGVPADAAAQVPDAGPRLGPLAIAVGDDAICVVAADRRVLCWGNNARGQLGDGVGDALPATHADTCGTGDCSLRPVEVVAAGGAPFRAIDVAAAPGTFCAISAGDALVYCWGSCDEQTCAQAGPTVQARASRVTSITATLVEVHGGRSYFCARATDGDAWCWGQNSSGQHGVGTFAVYYHGVAAAWRDTTLVVGGGVTCGLAADGTVTCAGNNDGGALGPNATVGVNSDNPIVVPFVTPPTALVAGAGFECALVGTTPTCWGESALGKLGRDVLGECVLGTRCDENPMPVGGGEAFTRVWAEGFSSVACAARADGAVFCWGAREHGEAGPPTAGGVPGRIALFQGAVDVAMGIQTTCAVLATGETRCMGSNQYGELQMPADTATHSTPVDVCVDTTCP